MRFAKGSEWPIGKKSCNFARARRCAMLSSAASSAADNICQRDRPGWTSCWPPSSARLYPSELADWLQWARGARSPTTRAHRCCAWSGCRKAVAF
eukprot:scaffold309093_cov32-Tisochrysis_lutea.AAC.1